VTTTIKGPITQANYFKGRWTGDFCRPVCLMVDHIVYGAVAWAACLYPAYKT